MTEPLVIPDRELLGVEHPCYVLNPERAVQTLGGEHAIARAAVADRSTHLECHLRPNDPLSHPLFGIRVENPAILLRVRRRRPPVGETASTSTAPPSGAVPLLDAEVMGVMRQSYRFEGLADFQYVTSSALCSALQPMQTTAGGPSDATSEAQGLSSQTAREALEASLGSHVLRIPPALFCAVDVPLDFIPRPTTRPAAIAADSLASDALSRPNPLKPSPQPIPVPPKPPPPPSAPKKSRRSRGSGPVPMHFGMGVEFACELVPQGPQAHVANTINEDDELYRMLQARGSVPHGAVAALVASRCRRLLATLSHENR